MYLMSKDVILAQINFDTMQFTVFKPDLMPFALRGNNVNLFTVYSWLENRVLHLSRSNAKKIISSMGLNQNNRIEICFACKGLSLIDCYWLKVESDKTSWNDVNLYSNSLSSAIAHIALTGEFVSIKGRVRTPELTNGGSYAKCWRRCKDGIYMYKTGSLQGSGKEYLVDILCSDILDKLNVAHVKYTLTQSGLRPVSRCKNMTSPELSICDMEYFEGYCNRNNINLSKWLESQKSYFDMLVIDYLIFNSDRHSGNWGVYFDANTGRVIGLHPLFDHNLSLDPKADNMSKVIQGKTLEECAKYAKKYSNLSTKDLVSWLKRKTTKARFLEIDKTGIFYREMLNRIKVYNSW